VAAQGSAGARDRGVRAVRWGSSPISSPHRTTSDWRAHKRATSRRRARLWRWAACIHRRCSTRHRAAWPTAATTRRRKSFQDAYEEQPSWVDAANSGAQALRRGTAEARSDFRSPPRRLKTRPGHWGTHPTAPRTALGSGSRARAPLLRWYSSSSITFGDSSAPIWPRRLGVEFSVIEPTTGGWRSSHQCEIIAPPLIGAPSYRYRITDEGTAARAAAARARAATSAWRRCRWRSDRPNLEAYRTRVCSSRTASACGRPSRIWC
jgi:hypothetical protein